MVSIWSMNIWDDPMLNVCSKVRIERSVVPHQKFNQKAKIGFFLAISLVKVLSKGLALRSSLKD
jgi:hypothetical protein